MLKQVWGPRFFLGSLVLAASLLAARPAAAQVFAYTSQAAYDAASFRIDTINFNGNTASQDGDTFYGNPGSLNVGEVNFTTNTGPNLFVIGPNLDPGYDFPGNDSATLDAQNALGGLVVINASLPTDVPPLGVSAVGTEIGGTFSADSVTVSVTMTSDMTYTYDYAASDAQLGLGFLGFVSIGDTIKSISFTDDSTTSLTLDNFTYGIDNIDGILGGDPLTLVPEPATWALFGAGAVALFFVRRRLVL